MKQVKMTLVLGALVAVLVLSSGCGAPATPVTPTSAATATTARAVPTVPPPTATRAPTVVAPTLAPLPTLAPTAVVTPTRAATPTRTRAPATKAPAVVPTKAAAATPTPKYVVPTGKAGLLIRNFFGQALFYTLPGRPETRIEGNSEGFFVLDAGTYTVTISVPGQYQENRTFDLKAGGITTQDFFAR